jgi:methylthioribose-1-phosphate isomerase
MKNKTPFKTLEWKEKTLYLLDQTRLPREECYQRCVNHRQVARAIRTMVVRGAPAIGVTAAFGLVLGALHSKTGSPTLFQRQMGKLNQELLATRPTAVNLRWALQRMEEVLIQSLPQGVPAVQKALEREALCILAEDLAANREMGRQGQMLIPDGAAILTHCNAGALATAGFGTALGVIRAALAAGKRVHVFIDETRPFLQGSRLTAWELMKDRIPCTLITDNMAAALMAQGKVDLAIVGADRIAANGDVANKIGTYSLACLCHLHRIPLYVAAPISTIDFSIRTGKDIPIEERNEIEVTTLCGKRIAPPGIKVWNPAFDVTPHRYIQAIITEKGIAQNPFHKNLAKLGAMKG